MVLNRQTAIEEIIKGVFDLTELQAVRLAGTIEGMVTTNNLQKVRRKKEEEQNAKECIS
ncbi:hypothetical protein PBV87_02605 [Niameybacter massiliensis]|uniref:Uncharacterized protein n=1 Tax=Holtiella tumoricola TaxID=3018743 RepID=A0AA42IZR3_9FIRM|nr:hypothetical protein [Holtiella tumoricola]MDA3730396.1 hypothetical protein [Holtiella tumoricola]